MLGVQKTIDFPVRKSARQLQRKKQSLGNKNICNEQIPQDSDLEDISRLSVSSPSSRTRSKASKTNTLAVKASHCKSGKKARTRNQISLSPHRDTNSAVIDETDVSDRSTLSTSSIKLLPSSSQNDSPRKRTPTKDLEMKPLCSPSKKKKDIVECLSPAVKSCYVNISTPGKISSPRRLDFTASSPSKAVTQTHNTGGRGAPKELCINASPVKVRQPLSPISVVQSPRKVKSIDSKENICSRSLDFIHSSPKKLSSPLRESKLKELSIRQTFSPSKQRKENQSCSQENKSVRSLDFNLSSPCKLMSPLRLARQEGQSYHKVKQVLHTAMPSKIVCREKETAEINKFLDSHLHSQVPGSLYVSGAPGTGKTAVLSQMLLDLQGKKDCQLVYINCMTLKNTQAIYRKVYSELTGKEASFKTTSEAVRELEKSFTAKGCMALMILDEIDQLDSKNQEVLYTMFEWPALNNSRLVLIGIANALDLTDRILPRLQARPHCKPQLLNFPPYSKEQIVSVLKDRLKEVEAENGIVMEPMAIQFCARKVAAMAGDMRRALDICRRAVDVVETSVRSQQVLKVADCNSPRKSNQKVVPKKITVSHIASIVTEVYGSRMVSAPQRQQTIPLQQKLAVCTLLLLLKNGKAKEIALGKLHETYNKICKKRQLGSTDQSEFHSVCGLLESMGIIGMKKAKETRLVKISLKMEEKELEFALQDQTLMSSVLQDGIPR